MACEDKCGFCQISKNAQIKFLDVPAKSLFESQEEIDRRERTKSNKPTIDFGVTVGATVTDGKTGKVSQVKLNIPHKVWASIVETYNGTKA